MRKIFMGLVVAGVGLAGAQLSAQASKPLSIGIAGGAAIPLGDLADLYNTGYNGTVSLGLSSFGSPIGLRFEGMYNKVLGRDDVGNPPDARIVAGTANLVYALPGVGIRPYLIGGAGDYEPKPEAENF